MTEYKHPLNEPPAPFVAPRLLPFGAPGAAGLFDTLAAEADARHKARLSGKPFGPVTSLSYLDTTLGGALAPGLHIVHGSPGTGKTAFALQIAALCGTPALFVTTEMTPVELLRRHTARVTGTFLGRLKSGELAPADVVSMARKAAQTAPLVALLDATQEPAPLADVVAAAELTRAQGGPDALLLVVVDSLHTWADAQEAAPGVAEYDRLNQGLSDLRLLSKRLNCAVLAIAERNRGSMKGGGQSAGAGTRKIEYGAETVIELDVKKDRSGEDTRPNADGETEVELKISKNRHGSGAGKPLNLLFHGALQRFREDSF